MNTDFFSKFRCNNRKTLAKIILGFLEFSQNEDKAERSDVLCGGYSWASTHEKQERKRKVEGVRYEARSRGRSCPDSLAF